MTAQRDEAHKAAILAMVGEHLDTRYGPSMQTGRDHERAVWDVYDALRAAGDDRTAERIAQLLRSAKAALSIPQPTPSGRRFLAELMADPASAQLS